MVNPVLRKLSDPRLSRFDIASLIEKHIGDGSNEFHCEQAYKAFTRIREPSIRNVALLIERICKGNLSYCEIVKMVIENLRSEGWCST